MHEYEHTCIQYGSTYKSQKSKIKRINVYGMTICAMTMPTIYPVLQKYANCI